MLWIEAMKQIKKKNLNKTSTTTLYNVDVYKSRARRCTYVCVRSIHAERKTRKEWDGRERWSMGFSGAVTRATWKIRGRPRLCWGGVDKYFRCPSIVTRRRGIWIRMERAYTRALLLLLCLRHGKERRNNANEAVWSCTGFRVLSFVSGALMSGKSERFRSSSNP